MFHLLAGFIIGIIWHNYSQRNKHYYEEDWSKIAKEYIKAIDKEE